MLQCWCGTWTKEVWLTAISSNSSRCVQHMQFRTSSMCQYLEVPTSYETWMQSSLPTLPSNSHDFFCHQISILQLFSLRLPGSGQWNEGKGKGCISHNYMFIYEMRERHGRQSRPKIQVLNLNEYMYIYIVYSDGIHTHITSLTETGCCAPVLVNAPRKAQACYDSYQIKSTSDKLHANKTTMHAKQCATVDHADLT